ncbi:MAG: response regulator [Phycisphaerales bacterium]|jgi:excisionase family DNA binding protein|nr:response regulator [Phycisphaerales bacterium]
MSTQTGATNSAERWADKKVFTTGEAAQVCKVSQQTIIRCFDSGRLQGFRVPGSKFRRIPRDELLRFMRANGIPTEVIESSARRVLVVDDDPKICELFEDLLTRDGRFEVKTCNNGYDAGMQTQSFSPHAVILDYMLPDINGNVVCQRMRTSEGTRDAKIIFVSGVVNQDEVDALMQAGADAFIKKPFDIDELMDTLCELLGLETESA